MDDLELCGVVAAALRDVFGPDKVRIDGETIVVATPRVHGTLRLERDIWVVRVDPDARTTEVRSLGRSTALPDDVVTALVDEVAAWESARLQEVVQSLANALDAVADRAQAAGQDLPDDLVAALDEGRASVAAATEALATVVSDRLVRQATAKVIEAHRRLVNAGRLVAGFAATLPEPSSCTRSTPPPLPRLIRDWADAEKIAAEWVEWFGFGPASVTQATRDGGVDVVSATAVAQVKDYGRPCPAGPVREVAAIGHLEGKVAMIFARAGFTPDALDWGARAGVAMFGFDLQGTPTPHSPAAADLMDAPATSGGKGIEHLLNAAEEDDPLVVVRTMLQYVTDRMEELSDTSHRAGKAINRLRSSDFTAEQLARGNDTIQRLEEFARRAPEVLDSQVPALVERLQPAVGQIEAALELTPNSPQRVSALVDAFEALSQGYSDLDGLVRPLRDEQVRLLVELARTFDLDPSAWGITDDEIGGTLPL